jgi:lipopolysaccharide cholinephosphotransferase
MKDIDEICRHYDIEYYLLGGSALGAVRHRGFIPWDDDLDIIMTASNYQKFCHICKTKLDKEKYYFQEGLTDWQLNFSKIRLKGTYIDEIEADGNIDRENCGIFVDIFKLDNVCNSKIGQYWQYFCAKLWLSYLLSRGTYRSASVKKKIMMFLSKALSITPVEKFFRSQAEKYNSQTTDFYGFFFGRTNFHNSIIKKEIYGTPVRVPFEDTQLPIQEQAGKYLAITFGNYRKYPPEREQKPLHIISADFGNYK